MKTVGYSKRPLVLIGCILLLLLNPLTWTFQPIYETAPNPLLDSIPFPQEAIINQPYQFHFTLLAPVRAFLSIPSCTANLKLNINTGQRFLACNLEIALIILSMFYIFYRLSRTSVDDLIFNMGDVK